MYFSDACTSAVTDVKTYTILFCAITTLLPLLEHSRHVKRTAAPVLSIAFEDFLEALLAVQTQLDEIG